MAYGGKSRNAAQGVVSRNDNLLCQPKRLTVQQGDLEVSMIAHCISVFFGMSVIIVTIISSDLAIKSWFLYCFRKISSGPHSSLCQYESNAVITVLSNKIKTQETLINQLILRFILHTGSKKYHILCCWLLVLHG